MSSMFVSMSVHLLRNGAREAQKGSRTELNISVCNLVCTERSVVFFVSENNKPTCMWSRYTILDLLDATKSISLVCSMLVPNLLHSTLVRTYKTSQRHTFAHAIVNLGVCITLNPDQTVHSANILAGGTFGMRVLLCC